MICHWLTNNHNTISMCFWKYWELQVSTKSNRENLKFGDCFVITTLHSNPSIWGHLVTRSWFQNMPRLPPSVPWVQWVSLSEHRPGIHDHLERRWATWSSKQPHADLAIANRTTHGKTHEKTMKNQLQSVKLCYSEDVWGSLSALKSSREISIRNTSHVQQHVK